MSLLTIVQNACAELSLDQPASVVTATDAMTIQMLKLAQRAGDELARDHNWSALRVTRNFTCTGAMPEPTEPPSDWQCFADDAMFWNKSRNFVLNGPVDASTWQRNVIRGTAPIPQIYRMLGGKLAIYQNTAGEIITYEYLSTNWIALAAGTTSAKWVLDTDTAIIPERVLELSLIFRWKQVKGLECSVEKANYENAKQNEIGSDRSAKAFGLSLSGRGSMSPGYWPGVVSVS